MAVSLCIMVGISMAYHNAKRHNDKREVKGHGEAAQWLKSLLDKHKSWSWDPQNPHRGQVGVVTCNSSL